MIEPGSQRLDPIFHKSMFQRVNTLNSCISITEAASDAKLSAMDRSRAELQPDINNAKIIFFAKCPLLSNPVTYAFFLSVTQLIFNMLTILSTLECHITVLLEAQGHLTGRCM